MTKKKELVEDFRRNWTKLNMISILGDEVEVVEGYKHLGIHNKLEWKRNTEAVRSKGQSTTLLLQEA